MVENTISSGITFLANEQQKNGSFLSLSSADPKKFSKAQIYTTTFATALILSCLNSMTKTQEIQKIQKKAANFLLKQKSSDWSFNYWARQSLESNTMPYPDDLDDTFYSLAALYEYNPKVLDGVAYAKIIRLLTAAEVAEGGPYRTWLVMQDAPEVWKDVDFAVNCNVAYFLSLQNIELPKLIAYLETAVSLNQIHSPYYFGQLPLYYFLSRFYKGKYKDQLTQRLISQLKQSTLNPLSLSLCILSLLNFDEKPENMTQDIDRLLRLQKKDMWEPGAFYIDPTIGDAKHYAGSTTLTTAFCLLALDRYTRLIAKQLPVQTSTSETLATQRIHKLIVKKVSRRFSLKQHQLKDKSEKIVTKLLEGEHAKQITLLPYLLYKSLKHKINVPEQFLINLGAASLFGWMAYTIFDDFLDNEGEPAMLPIATISLRELTTIFTSILVRNTEFTVFFQRTMDSMEEANSWEVTNTRVRISDNRLDRQTMLIPEYGNFAMLANRSMGHAIAPAAVLYYLGYTSVSSEMKLLLTFFRHYIIARQLNDDAHDFAEDMTLGTINAVGAEILRELKAKHTSLPEEIPQLTKLMQEQFWNESVVPICNEIEKHIVKARHALQKNPLLQNLEYFDGLLNAVNASAKKALVEHENVTKFLMTYKNSAIDKGFEK